jgi:hypothetical protein
MSSRYDPRERWRWEEDQRDREEREVVEREGRFARDAGDPRWGTGGMPVDVRTYRALRETSGRAWPMGRAQRQAIARETPSYAEWEAPPRGPYVGRGPRGYRRSDERIREDVCERFTWHGHLDATDIEVVVRSGEITLTGVVETRAQKRLAEDIAEAVFGIAEVHNHLRVQRPEERLERPREALPSPRGTPAANGRRTDEVPLSDR